MKARRERRRTSVAAENGAGRSSTSVVEPTDSSTASAVPPTSPATTRVKAAVRVRPLVEMETLPTPSTSSSPPRRDDCHTRDPSARNLSSLEVIRVVTAAGHLRRPMAGPYMLEVLRPPTEGSGCRRSGQRPSMPMRQSASHNPRSSGGSGEAATLYAFDYCAGPNTTQEEFFEMVEMPALCEAALSGEVVTLLCFGQTGSGKTYSLSGRSLPAPPSPGSLSDPPLPLVAEDGLQYQAVHYIARRLKELRRSSRKLKSKQRANNGPGKGAVHSGDGRLRDAPAAASASVATVVTAKCSYVELYQESLYDLLQPGGGDGVRCRWSAAASSFFVEGSVMVECRGREDFLLVLREGQRNRQRGSHALNLDSSRSHVVFTIFFEARDEAVSAPSDNGTDSDGARPPSLPGASPPLLSTRYGRLVFVDLAGSERLKKTLSTSSAETGSINKSLFTLGRVLELLSAPPPSPSKKAPASSPFIPYRSSVLTQLLMHSLDGHGRTVMVACVSPSALHLEESLRTLHYAERARRIRATPVVHVDAATQERMALEETVRDLRKENALLRRALGLPRVGALQDGQVEAQLEALHRAWASAQSPAPPHEEPPGGPAAPPHPPSTPPRGSPPQKRQVTRAPPSRPAAPFAPSRITAAAGTLGLRSSTLQTVVMSSTDSDASDGPTSVTHQVMPPSSSAPTAEVNILALLEALPDTRSMHTQ
ncbi:hypothetical protein LSCM1_07929 [Leishmania martiniquensis]|uniref:Kinesin-like protein n=1 Tax=Leishmania martiniquensis TaxID=1580590 RepID=A0A836H4G0_9TRYP|nr:hypothetical protein LSCM1_07929 [Leishmania martiniquensis]